jgi:hypothetical protein
MAASSRYSTFEAGAEAAEQAPETGTAAEAREKENR